MAARSRASKPPPWRVDPSADPVRFGRRKGRAKTGAFEGSPGPGLLEAPQSLPGEDDPFSTTFEASYGTARVSDDRPSYLKDRPGGSNSRAPESMYQTNASEIGYDPAAASPSMPPRGSPGRSVVGVTNSYVGKSPGKDARVGGAAGVPTWEGDVDPYAAHRDGPIAETVKRRSKLADPGGSGEADVGAWAAVPRMRLGGQDPLGGPDRGRSGVEWGTEHFMKSTGQPVATLGGVRAGQPREPRESKPWESRGMHPGRRKQPVGGSDVLTGLWMSSGQSYGNDARFDQWRPDRGAKSRAAKEERRMMDEATYRPERVLSTAAVNGFLLDEGGAREARRLVAEEKAAAAKRSGKNTPLTPSEQYKLKQQVRKLNISGLEV